MAKLVILTLTLQEAKAILKHLPPPSTNTIGVTPEYHDAFRKLNQGVINANPLEKRQ